MQDKNNSSIYKFNTNNDNKFKNKNNLRLGNKKSKFNNNYNSKTQYHPTVREPIDEYTINNYNDSSNPTYSKQNNYDYNDNSENYLNKKRNENLYTNENKLSNNYDYTYTKPRNNYYNNNNNNNNKTPSINNNNNNYSNTRNNNNNNSMNLKEDVNCFNNYKKVHSKNSNYSNNSFNHNKSKRSKFNNNLKPSLKNVPSMNYTNKFLNYSISEKDKESALEHSKKKIPIMVLINRSYFKHFEDNFISIKEEILSSVNGLTEFEMKNIPYGEESVLFINGESYESKRKCYSILCHKTYDYLKSKYDKMSFLKTMILIPDSKALINIYIYI